jgi:hypothetical protein
VFETIEKCTPPLKVNLFFFFFKKKVRRYLSAARAAKLPRPAQAARFLAIFGDLYGAPPYKHLYAAPAWPRHSEMSE